MRSRTFSFLLFSCFLQNFAFSASIQGQIEENTLPLRNETDFGLVSELKSSVASLTISEENPLHRRRKRSESGSSKSEIIEQPDSYCDDCIDQLFFTPEPEACTSSASIIFPLEAILAAKSKREEEARAQEQASESAFFGERYEGELTETYSDLLGIPREKRPRCDIYKYQNNVNGSSHS